MTHDTTHIPEGWRETTLGEVVEIIGGGTPKTTIESYWNGDIPWLSVVDFNSDDRWVSKTEKSITQEGLDNSSTKLLNRGDIIISARGTVGALAQLKIPMTFNQSCYGIREIDGVSDENYLYYLIKFQVKQISKNVHGAVFDTITRDTFDSIKILLPPLPEQRAIADILSSLDAKIEFLREQNETLEKTSQTIFHEWFGRYSVESPEELPEGWRVGKLGEITEIKGGSTPSTQNTDFWNGDIAWTSPKDLSNSKEVFLLQTESKITSEGLKQISSGLLPIGTLLLSSRAPIGYLAITNIEVAINQGYIAFIDGNHFGNKFMYLWLKTNMQTILNSANGSTFLEISKSSFGNIEVVIPSKNIIDEFEVLINPIFEKILSNLLQIQSLSKTRDTLLPKLMSGEVRVG